MTTQVILERSFDPPRSLPEVQAAIRESGWCFEMYRVDWRSSFLAVDGGRMICWFAAPDTESARVALRQSGADTAVLWRGTVHEAPQPGVPNVLVECSFREPGTIEIIQAIEEAAARCLQGHDVRVVRTFFSVDRRRMLCLYEAPDVESVRLTQREAALPADAVWAFERIGPDTISSRSR